MHRCRQYIGAQELGYNDTKLKMWRESVESRAGAGSVTQESESIGLGTAFAKFVRFSIFYVQITF